MTDTSTPTVVRLEVDSLSDLLDRSPFHEGTLSTAAEAYILRRVKELPQREPVHVSVAVPSLSWPGPIPDFENVFRKHFAICAEAEAQGLQELFRTARRALVIGAVILSICLAIARYVSGLPQRPGTRILQESFVILGWVSVWKPIEMFLYDWMPAARRRDLCRRLAAAHVTVVTA